MDGEWEKGGVVQWDENGVISPRNNDHGSVVEKVG